MVDQHRAIKRQQDLYCMRCICACDAGDFPTIGKYRILHRLGQGGMGDVLAMAVQMVEAMDFAYKEHIVHRDLKPSNFFIDKGTIKIADFGMAKYFDEVGITTLEKSMGTLPFMPPEQFGNAKYADQRADIYSFGATLYTLATGEYPIPIKNISAKSVKRVLNEIPRPPSQIVSSVSKNLDQIILKCLAKKPEDRFDTPGEIQPLLIEWQHCLCQLIFFEF